MSKVVPNLVCLLSLAVCQTVAATETTARFQPANLLADAADGRFDQFTLLEAALIASGESQQDKCSRVLDKFRQSYHNLRAAIDDRHPTDETARNVFRLMHKFILTGEYRHDCSSVAETLATGHYNCLSATIIFQTLCDQFQLPVVPAASPGHVCNRFQGDKTFEIEPTCPRWFAGGANSSTRSRIPAGAANSKEKPIEITRVQLIARLFYNRATGQLGRQHFAEAIKLLQMCLQLDPEHAAAHTNLLAAFNNRALALCDANQFAAAAEQLREGLALVPTHEPFLANDLYVHGRWARRLCERGDFKRALTILESARRRRPDVPMFDRGRYVIVDAWAKWLMENADSPNAPAEAECHIDALIASGQPTLAKRLRASLVGIKVQTNGNRVGG